MLNTAKCNKIKKQNEKYLFHAIDTLKHGFTARSVLVHAFLLPKGTNLLSITSPSHTCEDYRRSSQT